MRYSFIIFSLLLFSLTAFVQENVASKLIPGIKILDTLLPSTRDDKATIIRIRCKTTVINDKPLFVIDGIVAEEFELKNINPNSIESIWILKDDTATTLYGCRAANGVILITTKNATCENEKSIVRIDSSIKAHALIVGNEVKIFPNPAKAGSDIKIEWKKAEAGEYNVDLYNLQGQLIQTSLLKTESETIAYSFHIPFVTPGSYVLRLTNKKSGKKHAEKIIIQ